MPFAVEENIIKKENHDKTDSDHTLLDESESLILKNPTDSSELFHNSNSALSEFIRQDKDSLLKLIELCWRSPLCKPHATADATKL